MSRLKINTNLFLEKAELDRLVKFLDTDGFRKNIIDNSVRYGLVKNLRDITFANARVEQDIDVVVGSTTFKTIKHNEIRAIDQFGNFIYKPQTGNIIIPADNLWYWVSITHQYSNQELGTFTISDDGQLTGSGSELTKILRGQPNFPSRVRFLNSTLNILDYDVVEVVNDNLAILNGVSFQPESNLKLGVVGTFTPGVAVPNSHKMIFEYDSCLLDIEAEENTNTRPTAENNTKFYLARIKNDGTNVIVQDKRIEYWETKGSSLPISIDETGENPLIGVESIKWNHNFTPADENIVEIAWGMRSGNWSVDASKNIITLFGSATGGAYKTIDDFVNGDFDGWRVYAPKSRVEDGDSSKIRYSRVISSVKQGNAINLQVDTVDVDDYSPNGGVTFYSEASLGSLPVLCVPNCEEVEFKFTQTANGQVNKQVSFPVNTLVGKCKLVCYDNPTCTYGVQYRYKTVVDYTEWLDLPADTSHGYLNELSFDADGFKLPEDEVSRVQYISNQITLRLAPHSYYNFRLRVDTGDLFGVNRTNFTASVPVVIWQVGLTEQYQYYSDVISIENDYIISILKESAREGNKFTLHLEYTTFTLNDHLIEVRDNYIDEANPGTLLKTITQADVYHMLNSDKGVYIDFIYDGTDWLASQSYSLPTGGNVEMLTSYDPIKFDSSGIGVAKPYFGHVLMKGDNNLAPNMAGRVPVGKGTSTPDSRGITKTIGDSNTIGGNFDNKLTGDNMPSHSHAMFANEAGGDDVTLSGRNQYVKRESDNGGARHSYRLRAETGLSTATVGSTSHVGVSEPFSNMQPYYGLYFILRLY